jgi:DNA-binding PucR family transcriptional regulator
VEDGTLVLGPLARLVAYDEQHHVNLLETLVAYLDAFGDVSMAAKAVHVHANTFRYRLRRLSAIGGLDLDDPDTRFSLMLRLRLWELGGRSDARFAFSTPHPR